MTLFKISKARIYKHSVSPWPAEEQRDIPVPKVSRGAELLRRCSSAELFMRLGFDERQPRGCRDEPATFIEDEVLCALLEAVTVSYLRQCAPPGRELVVALTWSCCGRLGEALEVTS